MKFKIRKLDIDAGARHIAVIHKKDAWTFDIHNMERIQISFQKKSIIAIVDTTGDMVKEGELGLFNETFKHLCGDKVCRVGMNVIVSSAPKPKSIQYIRDKLSGKRLGYEEFKAISQDIAENRLTDIEETYFVSACISNELTLKETVALINAMVDTGDRFNIGKEQIFDKHCIGGVAGNRTTMIVIPIIATYGLTIPKTSSRAITSPAGTADTVEVLCKVDLNLEQMKKVVEKTNGCMVWGGSLNLVPADDKIIRIEKPLSMDVIGIMLASVLGKKKSVSATHVLIDIPWGKGAKVKERKRALMLKRMFQRCARMLDMKMRVVLSDGTQPIGNGIGPVLEAKDVIGVLSNEPLAPKDLKEKSIWMAAELIALSGRESLPNALKTARHILESGQALKKFEDIINAQGQKILPSLGEYIYTYNAEKSGRVSHIGNAQVSRIARVAGAPDAPGAGVFLFKKVGENVKKGDAVMRIFSANKDKLTFAQKIFEEDNPYTII